MRKLFLTIVVTLEKWYWQCPHALKPLMKMLFFIAAHSYLSKKVDLWVRNSIFEKVFKIILSHQKWVLVTFWMSGSHRGHISNILWMLEAIMRENNFFTFLKFLASLLSNFGFKMKQIWAPNFWKCRFFKNEALNQKSGTVKVLCYA